MKLMMLFSCLFFFACSPDTAFNKPIPKEAEAIDLDRFDLLLKGVNVLRAWELDTPRANLGYKEYIIELKGFSGELSAVTANTISSKSTLTKPLLARLNNADNLSIARYLGFFSDDNNELKVSYSIDFVEFELKDGSTSEWMLVRENIN
jgi:hypothetical protein